jgi:hypothetical protein
MFKIIGGDGRQYGPVTIEEAREWIKAGRANAQSKAQKDGEEEWRPMSSFPEFADTLAAASGPDPLPPPAPLLPGPADPQAMADEALAQGGRVDIGSCLGRAWDLLTSDFWAFIGVSALMILLLSVVGILAGPIMGGLSWYYLKRIRQQPTQLNDAFAGFNLEFVQLFVGGLVVSLLVSLGWLACAIPGIYLAVAWKLTLPIIIDRRIGFWQAMEVSRRVVTRHWWSVLLFAIVCGAINFCGVLLCFVGVFFTFPLTMLATTFLYEDLFGNTKPANA